MPKQTQRTYSWLAHQPIQRKMLLAIGLMLALFVIANLAALYSLHRQSVTRNWAAHTYAVLLKLAQTEQSLQQSQIGARGYLIDGEAVELSTHLGANRIALADIDDLRQLISDNPLQQTRLDQLQTMLLAWQKQVDTWLLQPVKSLHGDDATSLALARVQVQDTYMRHRAVRVADLHARLEQMADTERQLLATREQVLREVLDATRAIEIGSAVLSLLLGLLVLHLTARMVTRPLRRMTELMTRLAAHDHTIEIRQVERGDEIGQIANALHVFKGMAIETTAQTRLKTQLSDLSQLLQEASDHRDFGSRFTRCLAPLLGAGVAMFYTFDPQRQRLDLIGSYGLRLGARPNERFVPGEGLAGQCALDRKAIEIEVPHGYVQIDSASGAATPGHVLIRPVTAHTTLVGVLELATFDALDPLQRQLLDEVLPLVALTLENLNRAVATQDLLEQTRAQADELRASEEAMRRQQQALRDSNDALQTKTVELEEQSQRLIASEEELRVQTEELQASNEELREKTESLNRQREVLEDLQLDTEAKAAELARASQYKSDFLANMSHELRTPLNSLLILSRSLSDNGSGNLDEEQVESARIIHDAGSTLLRLINDILDLSKIEAGKMELMIDALPLAQFERTLRRTFNHVAQQRQLSFDIAMDADAPAVIRTDGARLEQVVNNLLSNAFKFTAQGGVSVRFGRPDPVLPLPEALRDVPALAITVRDTGIGIPADKFQRVFGAFEQVDAGTSRQYGGTGLGLAISRRIAELLGGDIHLASTPGEGSTFTVLLPEASSTVEGTADDRSGTTAPSGEAVRTVPVPALLSPGIADDRDALVPGDTVILVIEDDAAFVRILVEMVRRKGHRALAAGDGESGLQLAKRYLPTGILLDVMLPGMDGWTVIERLKSEPATRQIPVHFISATDEAARGRELGAVGFLTKPVSREALGGAFERLLHFAEGRTRHLLVVDDDADSRAAVRTMLRHDNVVIDEAGSAEEALAKTNETTFDCIVLDLGLPGMSGMELLERLAQSSRGVPPVVIYSGRDLTREENLALRHYTDAIVVKGARSPERLLDEVSLFLHSIQQAPRRVASEQANGGELNGRRVLLVDDDMRNLFALSKVLRGWGLTVSMAQDGHKALRMLEDEPAMELVLMDIMMPGMDGYDTMRAIRSQPRFGKLPIIALTAKAMRGDREKCLEAGASDYLSKPIDIDRLSSLVRAWLQR